VEVQIIEQVSVLLVLWDSLEWTLFAQVLLISQLHHSPAPPPV